MKVFVTGGAGYIGSVTVERLISEGQQVAVFDNLSQGHAEAIHDDAVFIEGDLDDAVCLDQAIKSFAPDSHYGESKYILERMLHWLDRTSKVRFAGLRYFNAAGGTETRGEDHSPETHLRKVGTMSVAFRSGNANFLVGNSLTNSRFSIAPLIVALLLVALLTPVVNAEVIDVSDHGIVPGKDVTLAVDQLVQQVRDRSDVTLKFPKGQYDFYPDNAIERYRPVANHDNGLKRFGFPLFGCKNLTIDGGGSTFMFHGRMVPVAVDQSSNVTLQNFTIDWIRSFHAELTVIESGDRGDGFVVETDREKHPYEIRGGKILFERYGQLDPDWIEHRFRSEDESTDRSDEKVQSQRQQGEDHINWREPISH